MARLETRRAGILVLPFFGYSLLTVTVVPPLELELLLLELLEVVDVRELLRTLLLCDRAARLVREPLWSRLREERTISLSVTRSG